MRIAHPALSLISFIPYFSPSITKLHCFHFPTSRVTERRAVQLSMAGAENVSTTAIEEDAQYGFKRSEMYKSNLTGTVDPYDRHVFLCFKNPGSWPRHVEEEDLPKFFSSAFKARKNDITVKTKVTICEGGEGFEFEDGDVLIFPDMIKYKGLKDSDVDDFVDDVLVNGKQWAPGVQELFTGSFVFVCAHGSRDKRCGVCGPILIGKLKEGIHSRGLNDQVFVSACSHVGGHKYAGNVIIYSSNSEGKPMGHWYGYVTPDDVPELLDQHIGNGIIIERIWRGQMGVSAEECETVGEKKLPSGIDDNKSKSMLEETRNEVAKDNLASCCLGSNGFSCCRDGSSEMIEEKKRAENIEVHGKKGLDKISSWIGSLEQSDFLAAAAVVGALATVAVAYNLAKRSG